MKWGALFTGVVLFLTSCAGLNLNSQKPYLERAKEALAVGKTAYLATSGIYLELKSEGLLKDELIQKIEEADKRVKIAHNSAQIAIEVGEEFQTRLALNGLFDSAEYLVSLLDGVLSDDTLRSIKITLIVMKTLSS